MLRVVAHKSAAAALQYYADGLRREDYYAEGQEVAGKWHGLAAARLNLVGSVTPKHFAALVHNKHPFSGEQLTPRMNVERRVGYDLNFHAPKSLSLLHALTGDERIVTAFREAVAETMAEIEALTATRIRKSGAQGERFTSNLVWAEFVHFTARPVGGIPDPHLHVHAFCFNSTYDEVENRWKAVSWADIKSDAPYSEAVFHSRLTDKINKLGIDVVRTKQGWEVAGVPRSLIESFSRRTAQIERLADERGIVDPKAKDALGAATREGKRRGMTMQEMLAAWDNRLTPEERQLFQKLGRGGLKYPRAVITPETALNEAAEKLFAKSSVADARRLVAEALRFGVGHVTPDAIWAQFERQGFLTQKIGKELLCTSAQVLNEEVALIHRVRDGKNCFTPLNRGKFSAHNAQLSAQQLNAVAHILHSRDRVCGVRGAAGVGKTTAMREAVLQIEATGKRVFAFAPSAGASRGTLRDEGFAGAETIASLLHSKKLQQQVRGQVVWIDEAGQVSVPDLLEVLRIMGDDTRLILTGDIAQHAPVGRGDGFRLLSEYAGLSIAEITEIRRQIREDYRSAVAAMSKGDLRTAFRRLDDMGAIMEIQDDAERYQRLAQDFLSLTRGKTVPLVVSPTHAEGAMVTAAIREAKRAAGLLGTDRKMIQYHDLNWEEPDRRRAENYFEGLAVRFHIDVKGIRRGSLLHVMGSNEHGEVLVRTAAGNVVKLPLDKAERFQVFEQREIQLAEGDRIRITRNGKCEAGNALNNGAAFTIKSFDRQGRIVLENGRKISADFGHWAHGLVFTSHVVQSKSVRDVLVAQRSDSFLAASKEQIYVSCSRGKETIRIYTDSRQELQEAVGYTSTRRAGIELIGLNAQEVSEIVSGRMDSQQWADVIRSRRPGNDAESVNHEQALLKQRGSNAAGKPETMDFRAYIRMQRANAGSDGKSRSKGHPPVRGQKINEQAKGRSFVRPTELTDSTKQKIADKKQVLKSAPKPQSQGTRANRLQKSFSRASETFNKLAAKSKAAAKTFKKEKPVGKIGMPKGNSKMAAGLREKFNRFKTSVKTKVQSKVKQKAPAPAPVRRVK